MKILEEIKTIKDQSCAVGYVAFHPSEVRARKIILDEDVVEWLTTHSDEFAVYAIDEFDYFKRGGLDGSDAQMLYMFMLGGEYPDTDIFIRKTIDICTNKPNYVLENAIASDIEPFMEIAKGSVPVRICFEKEGSEQNIEK